MSSNSIEKNHLNAEIEINLLKKALADKEIELNNLKSECYEESNRRGEIEDVVLAWQDKFERLFESYKKIHKVNQNLEDKLLKLVDRNSGERAKLTTDCTILNIRLRQANSNISHLHKEIERYKQDITLAIQLLHCKPNSFYSQNLNSLPANMQSKIASYMKLENIEDRNKIFSSKGRYQMLPTSDDAGKDEETTILSTVNNNTIVAPSKDPKVSTNVIADFLESEVRSTSKYRSHRHCDTCSCSKKSSSNSIEMDLLTHHLNASTQTEICTLNCIRCSSGLNSPSHTNSPYFSKLKSSDSVISETKSSVSDFTNQNDKTFSPSKLDADLLVNPVLGHHRLCDFRNFHNHLQSMQKESKLFDDDISRKCDSTTTSNKSNCYDKGSSLAGSQQSSSAGENITSSKVKQPAMMTTSSLEKNTMSHGPGNGSNNSIWSRTSNKECNKIFENFNRKLIKAMKAEYPRKNAPRICALKIQDDTSNVVLGDNYTEAGKTVVYRRRSRLLDDAFLEDEKSANNIPGNIPINLESSSHDSPICSSGSGEINQNCNIPCSAGGKNETMVQTTSKKDNSINGSGGDIPVKKDATESAVTMVTNRCFDLTTHNNQHELNENIMYRKQKFVAEWLKNSSNIPKGKTNSVLDVDAAIENNIKELDFENNNSTEASFSSSSAQLKQNNSNESISNHAQQAFSHVDQLKHDKILLENSCESSEEIDDDSSALAGLSKCNVDDDDEDEASNVDLAQMEYNVRKFLLKQHEWSMTSVFQTDDLNDLYSDDDEDEPIFVRRTETNL